MVRSVRRLPDGLVVVTDRSLRVRWFAPDGSLLRQAGGEGDGPGEFRSIPHLLILPGDSVLAVDAAVGRRTVFAPDGSLARVEPLGLAGRPGFAYPIDRMGDDRLLFEAGRLLGRRSGHYRDTASFFVVGVSGQVEETEPYASWEYFADTNEKGATPHYRLALSGVSHAAGIGDTVWVLAEGGPRVDAWVRGERVASDSMPGERLPLDSDARRRWIDQQEVRIEPERRAAWRASRERLPFVTEHPPFDTLVAGRDGSLWARRLPFVSSDRQEWVRVRGDSDLPVQLVLPVGFRLFDVGHDYVAGVATDDFDIEYVDVLVLSPR